MSDETFYLIDGHSLVHRAFYALPEMTTAGGEHTNAVYGFVNMLLRLLQERDPHCLVVAFDRKAPTFRHERFADYKAHREKMPEALAGQLDYVEQIVTALGITTSQLDGYEADDIIGTMAKKAAAAGFRVYIVTGDNDCLQLVDDRITVLLTRRGITNMDEMDADGVREKLGVHPWQVADYKGLVGDQSDNIPGIPGVGPKTAEKLLREYATVEEVLANQDRLTKRLQKLLAEHGQQGLLSKELATICTEVPLDLSVGACRIAPPDWATIDEIFQKLEFKGLYRRVQEQFGSPPEQEKTVSVQGEFPPLTFVEEGDELPAPGVGKIYLHYFPQGPGLGLLQDGKGYYIPGGTSLWDEFVRGWQETLADPHREKIIYGAKDQIRALRERGLTIQGVTSDPMLAAYLLNPGENRLDLDYVYNQYFGQELPGEPAAWLGGLAQLDELLPVKLQEQKLDELYEEMEMPLSPILAGMEERGIKIDGVYLQGLEKQMEGELAKLTEEIYALAGESFNINSPKQLGRILFDKLGLPVIKKTKTGPSTSAEVLEELADKHPMVAGLLEYRQTAKLLSTYVHALPMLINPHTGRIHTTFHQTVTATGRLSSSDPNLQNIPIRTEAGRQIRRAFVPGQPHWALLTADYSQIELRVLAHMSGDENLIDAFTEGQDIHSRTAAEVFDLPLDQVTPELRNNAKAINFGIIYGISSFGLAKGTGLSRTEAQAYIDKYFARYPGVKAFIDETIAGAKENGYVQTMFGRRRYLPEIRSRNWTRRQFAERMAMNSPIQGTAADIIKLAMIQLAQRDYPGHLLLQVHDELVFEAPREDIPSLAKVVQEVMENVVELKVPLLVEIKVGDNWNDVQPYTAEDES
ncbi:MAG: DNA polymerase I [Limnochordia bacterium]|jgi:DNA polymerase-1